MKAKLTGKIVSVKKEQDGGNTLLEVATTSGKVDTRNVTAQDCSVNGTITLKSMIANEMKIGATLTITISDEDRGDEFV